MNARFLCERLYISGTDTEDETACTREAEAEFGIEFPYTYATYIRKLKFQNGSCKS